MEKGVKKSGVNLLGMFSSVLVFILLTAYVTIAIAAGDFIWFVKGFSERPVLVVVYHDGRRSAFQIGEPGYLELATAVRDSLDQGVVRLSGIGLSAESLQDAYTKYLTVEAFFDKPVKIHAWFNTGHPTQMLFPITGRHSEQPIVFLGEKGRYMVNAPVLKSNQPIRQALQSLGLYSQ